MSSLPDLAPLAPSPPSVSPLSVSLPSVSPPSASPSLSSTYLSSLPPLPLDFGADVSDEQVFESHRDASSDISYALTHAYNPFDTHDPLNKFTIICPDDHNVVESDKKKKKPNVKRFGGEKFFTECPNDECVMGNAAIERLGGCGQSREGYYCSEEHGGCGNRWSQRTYLNDEVTAEVGTDDPCIRRCAKLSHREKKLQLKPRLLFKKPDSKKYPCTRSSGCWKANNHRGRCALSRKKNAVYCAPVLRIIDDKEDDNKEDTDGIISSFFN